MSLKTAQSAVATGLFEKGVGASRVFCPADTGLLRLALPLTLLAFLCQRYPLVDADIWRNRLQTGKVRNQDGVPYLIDAPYPANQTVYYFREVAQEAHLPYYETVLYQDDSLVVADKPHFLPVIPSGSYVQETLLVRLKNRLNLPDLVPLHRIDRDTAGIVLFGVQPQQRGAYQNLFRDRRVQKTYQALARYDAHLAAAVAEKTIHNQRYSIINHLEDAANFMQVQVRPHAEPNAHTDIVGITRLNNNHSVAQYTLAPLTGKRHQLRVHMMSLGVPIIGDEIYPTLLPERDIAHHTHAPLQLLASSIAFIDPIKGQARYFASAKTLVLSGV
jgi:tRNA pseudouridine32 synthase/23S rRNA pseudouridine746 synthase